MNKNLSVQPNINDKRLIKEVEGLDESGNYFKQNVVMERPLTIFLNRQEVVTSMTVGDHPEWMAVGFLINQGMLSSKDNIVSVDLDWDVEAIVVRTDKETNYEDKLKKKIRTSGCAVGTMFADVMDIFDKMPVRQRQQKILFKVHSDKLKMATIASFKGWDRRNIIIITDKKSNLEKNNARMDFEFYTSMTRVREKVFILNRNKRYEEFLNENYEKY